MAIKKYIANKDNTITNAFKIDLQTRATGANMGLSDILETFSIYGQASSGSTELERILIEFPISNIISDRSAGDIPDVGKVNFFLNMYNAPNNQTTPRELKLVVSPVSQAWQEGTGLDMDEYDDTLGKSPGSDWVVARSGAAGQVNWSRQGGDYLATPTYEQIFPNGDEDLRIDITSLVEEWVAGTKDNYGIGVHLTASQEAFFSNSAGVDVGSQLFNPEGAQQTFYTKKFFGRGSEFFFKRPSIEAVWDSSLKDDRGNFYASSSLLTAEENNNTLYLYNSFRGVLRNIPDIGTGPIKVRLYTSSSAGTLISTHDGGYVSRGIYSASIALATKDYDTVYDRWFDPTFNVCYHTGAIEVKTHNASTYSHYPNYVTSLTNLKPIYYTHETARFKFYVRHKDWSPTIYTVATTETDTLTIESASYQIHRVIDDFVAIPFDTGSYNGTQMSFDVSGNYFDVKMDLFEPGYSYGIKIAYYDDAVKSYIEQPYEWKFRVEKV